MRLFSILEGIQDILSQFLNLIFSLENIFVLATAIDRKKEHKIRNGSLEKPRIQKVGILNGKAPPPEIRLVWHPQFFKLVKADFVFILYDR